MKNEDPWREMLEGTRHNAKGARVPTPFRCSECPNDACYQQAPRWYYSIHWAQLHGNGIKPAVAQAVPSTDVFPGE